MIRFGLLASVAVGALVASMSVSTAQDAFNWSGLYIGGALGGGGIDNQTETYQYGQNYLTGLLTAGVNWQDGALVYGVEGDIGLVSNSGAVNSDDIDPASVSITLNPVATLRGRLGYSTGNFLLYGTAGLAVAKLDIGDGPFSASGSKVGAVVGVGVEVAVTESLSIKAEGRYTNFGEIGDDPYVNNVNTAVGLVGVNFHF